MKHIAWLDAAKAICITFVVWSHFNNHGVVEYTIYSFTAQLLFLLSGYLFRPERPLGGEFVKKLRSLMVPYWCYLALWLPFGIWFTGQDLRGFLSDVTFYTGMLQWHTPLWFLPTLFIAWLICALLWKIVPGRIPQYVLVAGCIAVSTLMPRSLSFLRMFGVLRALACVPMFLFGYWCREWDLVARVRRRPLVLALILAAGVALALVLNTKITIYRYNYGTYPYTLVGGLALSLAICAALSFRESYPPIVSTFASGTVFMMATHMPLALVYRQYLEAAVLARGELFMTLVTGAIAAAIIAVQCLLMPQLRRFPRMASLFGLR